ncbi:hypothetical protein KAF25_002799 [Fusarium avenaceum]|uniref:Uncharacterized protein n=1 Tax=Fusarium avenaceum TaxID=40199 RepID=A0A9P7KW84_9HYPO|nr:hypothetical protein KAF25_002799 [Fusarium avenaceum]
MHPKGHLPQSIYPTLLMIDKNQCQAHTRNPWGRSQHRYDYRFRYLLMGSLSILFLAVVIVVIIVIVETSNGH